MDGLPKHPEFRHMPPAPSQPSRQRFFFRKLIGMLVGALAGMPIGWLIGALRFGTYETYDLVAGALAGAVIGCIFPGRTLGGLGWGIVLGTGGGAIFAEMISPPKGSFALLGAVIGFGVGLIAGLVLELRRAFARSQT
jgi:hypothetical protein